MGRKESNNRKDLTKQNPPRNRKYMSYLNLKGNFSWTKRKTKL